MLCGEFTVSLDQAREEGIEAHYKNYQVCLIVVEVPILEEHNVITR